MELEPGWLKRQAEKAEKDLMETPDYLGGYKKTMTTDQPTPAQARPSRLIEAIEGLERHTGWKHGIRCEMLRASEVLPLIRSHESTQQETLAKVLAEVAELETLAATYEASAEAEQCVVEGLEPYRARFHAEERDPHLLQMMRIFVDARQNKENAQKSAKAIRAVLALLTEMGA